VAWSAGPAAPEGKEREQPRTKLVYSVKNKSMERVPWSPLHNAARSFGSDALFQPAWSSSAEAHFARTTSHLNPREQRKRDQREAMHRLTLPLQRSDLSESVLNPVPEKRAWLGAGSGKKGDTFGYSAELLEKSLKLEKEASDSHVRRLTNARIMDRTPPKLVKGMEERERKRRAGTKQKHGSGTSRVLLEVEFSCACFPKRGAGHWRTVG
jgi:hypothetical protein